MAAGALYPHSFPKLDMFLPFESTNDVGQRDSPLTRAPRIHIVYLRTNRNFLRSNPRGECITLGQETPSEMSASRRLLPKPPIRRVSAIESSVRICAALTAPMPGSALTNASTFVFLTV